MKLCELTSLSHALHKSQLRNSYTYKVVGLPPGPICAPGLKSILAVLEPARHDYLYFVALPDGSGRHAFAETFEEHLENVRKYQQGQ